MDKLQICLDQCSQNHLADTTGMFDFERNNNLHTIDIKNTKKLCKNVKKNEMKIYIYMNEKMKGKKGQEKSSFLEPPRAWLQYLGL